MTLDLYFLLAIGLVALIGVWKERRADEHNARFDRKRMNYGRNL